MSNVNLKYYFDLKCEHPGVPTRDTCLRCEIMYEDVIRQEWEKLIDEIIEHDRAGTFSHAIWMEYYHRCFTFMEHGGFITGVTYNHAVEESIRQIIPKIKSLLPKLQRTAMNAVLGYPISSIFGSVIKSLIGGNVYKLDHYVNVCLPTKRCFPRCNLCCQ